MSVDANGPVAGVDPAGQAKVKRTIAITDAAAMLFIVLGATLTLIAVYRLFGVWYGLLATGVYLFAVGVLLGLGDDDE